MKLIVEHLNERFTYEYPDLEPNEEFSVSLVGKRQPGGTQKLLMQDVVHTTRQTRNVLAEDIA